MMKIEALSCELLTKHTRDFIVNAMSNDWKLSRFLRDEEAGVTPGKTNKNSGRERLGRYDVWGVILLCSAGLFLGGCVVSKGKYEKAVMDREAMKTELEKSRAWHTTLKQENERLQAENEKAAMDLEMLSAEIQQIKEGQKSELDLLATREAELQRARESMAGKLRKIQRVSQKLQSENHTLRNAVRRYQKELEEARKARVKSAMPVPKTVKPTSLGSEAKPVSAKKPSSQQVPPPVATPFKETVSPVNINTASANDLVLFLGLSKELANKVVLNRPYRLRGELISKQVVPQPTFVVIKDRITAAPQ